MKRDNPKYVLGSLILINFFDLLVLLYYFLT